MLFPACTPRPGLLPAVLLTAALFTAAAAPVPAQENTRVSGLLDAYQTLINRPPDAGTTAGEETGEDPSGDAWKTIRNAISMGFLRFSPDPSDSSAIEGARFRTTPDSKTAYILFSKPLLDAWENRPAFAYTVLTRSFREVSNYFHNPAAWSIAQAVPADKFILRMDSYHAAALFVRDRLPASGLVPGPYEDYLLTSHEQDNLASVALYLERTSLNIANALEELRRSYEQDGDSDSLRREILQLGEALLENRDKLEDNSDDQTIYPQAVAIHTWLEFTPWMMSRIYNKGNKTNPLAFDKVLEQEAGYARLRRMLDARRIIDMPIVDHIYKANIKGFEAG